MSYSFVKDNVFPYGKRANPALSKRIVLLRGCFDLCINLNQFFMNIRKVNFLFLELLC